MNEWMDEKAIYIGKMPEDGQIYGWLTFYCI